MRILVIDDERNFNPLFSDPNIDATMCRNIFDATLLIEDELGWDQVWLDHDLGMGSPEVYALCMFAEEMAYNGHPLPVKEFVIHSSNPVGRERMKAALDKYYNVRMVRAEDYL